MKKNQFTLTIYCHIAFHRVTHWPNVEGVLMGKIK